MKKFNELSWNTLKDASGKKVKIQTTKGLEDGLLMLIEGNVFMFSNVERFNGGRPRNDDIVRECGYKFSYSFGSVSSKFHQLYPIYLPDEVGEVEMLLY